MEENMHSFQKMSVMSLATCLSVALAASVFGHGGGGASSKNLIRVAFVANPNVPEFVGASGTAAVNLSAGVIKLEKLTGFPINPSKNLPLTINLTTLTDPRLKGHGGALGPTSCTPPPGHEDEESNGHDHGAEETSEHDHAIEVTERAHEGHDHGDTGEEKPVGPWTCHVHSYVVWLVGLEDGELGHVMHLGTIYPRADGTAADRDFSAREGDLTGLGMNAVIITAESTFGPVPSPIHGHGEETSLDLVPRGPIVLQASIP
jgi:hypothetical protein